MALKRSSPGRPHKGDRHVLTARVPVSVAEKVFLVAEHEGTSASQFLADLIQEKISTIDFSMLEGPEELPISQVS